MSENAISSGGDGVMMAYETLLLLRHKANDIASAMVASSSGNGQSSDAMDVDSDGSGGSSGGRPVYVGKFSDHAVIMAGGKQSALAGVKRKVSSVDEPSSLSYSLQEDIDGKSLEILHEENAIIIHQFCKIIQQHFGPSQQKSADKSAPSRHWRVAATAIVYMLKFYANNSLLLHDPRMIMVTSVFLAGKSEELYVSLRELQAVHKTLEDDEVKRYEFILLEALDFNLRVYHPNNILPTIVADMKKIAVAAGSDNAGAVSAWGQELSAAAALVLVSLQLSYANLCCSPLAVALFALEVTQSQLCAAEPSNIGVFVSVDQYIGLRYGEAFYSQYSSVCRPRLQVCFDYSNEGVNTNDLKKYLSRLKTLAIWSKK